MSTENVGDWRYVTAMESVPSGCETAGNVYVFVGSTVEEGRETGGEELINVCCWGMFVAYGVFDNGNCCCCCNGT